MKKFVIQSLRCGTSWLGVWAFVLVALSQKGVYGQTPQSGQDSVLGETLVRKDLGLSVQPPAGWSVEESSSLTYIFREPEDPKPSYDKPKYRRNITVAMIPTPSPIDEIRKEELKKELMEKLGKGSDFQIMESQILKEKGVEGILVYSTVTLAGTQVMQAHFLSSGSKRQFLATYSDLADRMNASGDTTYNQAWASLMSLEIEGTAPKRVSLYRTHIAVGALTLGLLVLFTILSWVRSRKSYSADVFDLEEKKRARKKTSSSGTHKSHHSHLTGSLVPSEFSRY